jgi:hypothetical protein
VCDFFANGIDRILGQELRFNESFKKYKTYDLPVDPLQNDRASKIKLCSFKRPHMRAFHYAWWSYHVAFLMWYVKYVDAIWASYFSSSPCATGSLYLHCSPKFSKTWACPSNKSGRPPSQPCQVLFSSVFCWDRSLTDSDLVFPCASLSSLAPFQQG